MRETQDQRTEETDEAVVVLRVHPLVAVAALAVAPAVGVLIVVDAPRRGRVDWFGVAVVAIFGVWTVAELLRQRVVIGPTTVQVRRLLTSETVDRASVDTVHRSGGKGRPAYVARRVEARASAAHHGRTRSRRQPDTGAVAMPGLIGSERVARALDVRYLSWSGKEPVPGPLPRVTFRRITTQAGMLTWLLTICLVALVGTIVVGGLVSVLAR